jgi:Holliday junction resolvasome RuvABC endonuclease subunit
MKILALDQSLRNFAWCLTNNGRIVSCTNEKLDEKVSVTFERFVEIRGMFRGLLLTHKPDIVTVEDYAFSQHSTSDAMLKELGGILKMTAHDVGYRFDRQAIIDRKPTFLVQGSGFMKMCVLGKGTAKKDTKYLLLVKQKTGLDFDDDNKADAYMHAYTASLVASIVMEKAKISDLPLNVQEGLICHNLPKGMSKTKALKLPEEEKLALARL